jgi:hypothetical protein
MAWHKVCKPTAQGGLGLRSIVQINKGANMKLLWDMLNSSNDWAILLKSKVLRHKGTISHHISSSLWSSINPYYSVIIENSCWLLGRGDCINFWLDDWCCQPLVDFLHIPLNLHHHLSAKVADFFMNQHCHVSDNVHHLFPTLRQSLDQITIPFEPKNDTLIWKGTASVLLLKMFKARYGLQAN